MLTRIDEPNIHENGEKENVRLLRILFWRI